MIKVFGQTDKSYVSDGDVVLIATTYQHFP